jgi:hypothetical protein
LISPIKRLLQAGAYGLFCGLDHLIWFAVKLLPGPRLFALCRQRPWRRPPAFLNSADRERWLGRISWLLRQRCRRAAWGSSCLSRSLAGRLLLDWLGLPNELHLGMGRDPAGDTIPHGWLSSGGRNLTPGLDPRKGAHLITL